MLPSIISNKRGSLSDNDPLAKSDSQHSSHASKVIVKKLRWGRIIGVALVLLILIALLVMILVGPSCEEGQCDEKANDDGISPDLDVKGCEQGSCGLDECDPGEQC